MQYDDLKVVLTEAENELGVMVERTEEWLARGQDQRQLERLKIVKHKWL